jgi:hypothetical protein
MKIAFITPYPFSKAPSQRFRFEQYFGYLKAKNIQFEQYSFLDNQSMDNLYKKDLILKGFGVVRGFTRRFKLLFNILKYDVIFIHREASPIGLPVFEWLVFKIFKGEIIYDFDDAIWLGNVSEVNREFSFLKCYWKNKYICKWASVVICGNQYLAKHAQQYNANVKIIPTTIDTENYHNKQKKHLKGKVVDISLLN